LLSKALFHLELNSFSQKKKQGKRSPSRWLLVIEEITYCSPVRAAKWPESGAAESLCHNEFKQNLTAHNKSEHLCVKTKGSSTLLTNNQNLSRV
jgi:hypothetical protein